MKKLLKGVFAVLLFSIAFSLAIPALGTAPVIYVSGSPDSYPIEYYQSGKKAYRGYIPSLLSEFAEEYGYTVEYITADADGRRGHLRNSQADIISAATEKEFSAEELANGITVFRSETEYRLLFTDATGETLKRQLTEFCAGLTEERANVLLLGVIGNAPFQFTPARIVMASAAALVLIAVLVLLIFLPRKRRAALVSRAEALDFLTGVGNYRYLEEYFKKYVTSERRSLYSAVYFVGRLKNTREDQGALLKLMAATLDGAAGEADALARVNDGFLVMKYRYGNDAVEAFAENTVKLLRATVKSKNGFASAVITAGVFHLGAHDGDLDRVLSNTAYCCRFAEEKDEVFTVYSKTVEKAEREEAQLQKDLKGALERDQFVIYLQFFVHSETKEILGAEALSRWNHPSFGMLNPKRYIDLVEKEKLYHMLDYTVLRKTCEALEEFGRATDKVFCIACNFSRNTIVMPDFAERVKQIVSEYDFPRERLLLEVTEYTKVLDTKALFDNVRKIKELGIKVVIDDFGNGFSDLSDIGKAKFDGVKFDRTLIVGEHTEADDIILKSLIDLMHSLGMTVIAEGIENEEQSERFLRAGCKVNQGFGYYLPLPKAEALRIFLNQK